MVEQVTQLAREAQTFDWIKDNLSHIVPCYGEPTGCRADDETNEHVCGERGCIILGAYNAGRAEEAAKREAEVQALREANYKRFTDGMEAAAQICGSLAETTYDDSDSFEAATGCEAAIMRVVREQRAEQARAALGDTQ